MNPTENLIVDATAVNGHALYQTIVTSGNHTIIIDEPVTMGGADTGMAPYSLLLASLASCTAITLRMYINRKMWLIDEIAVSVEMRKHNNELFIVCKLGFKGDVTAEQKKRLITIADACPIHKLLAGSIGINTSLHQV